VAACALNSLPTSDFIDKWLAFEPEGRLAANFLGPALGAAFHELSALLFELEDSALRIAEPTVAAGKLAWWQDELERAGRGGARHPLTLALAGRAPQAPFAGLAAPLAGLHRFESAADDAGLHAVIEPWCTAQAALAAAVTQSDAAAWPFAPTRRQFLLRRLRELDAQARIGRLWVPLDLMAAEQIARHRLSDRDADEPLARARRSMARRLLAQGAPAAPRHPVAAVAGALSDLRLERMALRGRDQLPALRALWRAWRAAQGRVRRW
jgi:15-cis-phytoene synthase